MGLILKRYLLNKFVLASLGIILFIFFPILRAYVIIAEVFIFINYKPEKNLYVYFAYSALSSMLSIIPLLMIQTTNLYPVVYDAIDYLTYVSIGNIFDLLFYIDQSYWNIVQYILSAILFGLTSIVLFMITRNQRINDIKSFWFNILKS